MSKAILVMDMPKSCIDCPLKNDDDDCVVQDEESNRAGTFEELRLTCPLRELPQKRTYEYHVDEKIMRGYRDGYNACIDEIMKGCEENG